MASDIGTEWVVVGSCKHAGLPEPGLISTYTVCGTEYYLLSSISAFWRNG